MKNSIFKTVHTFNMKFNVTSGCSYVNLRIWIGIASYKILSIWALFEWWVCRVLTIEFDLNCRCTYMFRPCLWVGAGVVAGVDAGVGAVGGVEVDTGIGAGGGARCSPLFGSSSPCLCSFLIMFQMILCMVVRIAHLLLLEKLRHFRVTNKFHEFSDFIC